VLIRPRILALFTTRRCTAACDNCCVGSSPRATGGIPIPRMHALIDEAKRIPSIERIVFTGGECFLLGKELDALIAHAHELEFRTRVVSNGYWAVNERGARERVRTLRGAGLDEMMLSTGTFHQEFVPVGRIVHAARAAAAAGIGTHVSVEDCDQSAFDDGVLGDELCAEIAARTVSVEHYPWIGDAGARGRTVPTHERAIAAEPGAALGRCDQIMTVVSVTPKQVLTACCGFPLEELDALHIGSVADRALDDVLRDAPNELLKMWLHVAGPAGIADFVARHVPGFELPPSASICQSCVAIQRDERALRAIADHGAVIAQTIAAEYVRLQSSAARPLPLLSSSK
jgi:hypothetical protein